MKRVRILVIDDSAFMRTILKNILLDQKNNLAIDDGLEIYEADSKESATKLLKDIEPDLILLDIVMKNSETEGLEFIQAIKSYFDTTKIIMITSMGLAKFKQKCKHYGVENYIQKPFDKELVVATVNKVLTTH